MEGPCVAWMAPKKKKKFGQLPSVPPCSTSKLVDSSKSITPVTSKSCETSLSPKRSLRSRLGPPANPPQSPQGFLIPQQFPSKTASTLGATKHLLGANMRRDSRRLPHGAERSPGRSSHGARRRCWRCCQRLRCAASRRPRTRARRASRSSSSPRSHCLTIAVDEDYEWELNGDAKPGPISGSALWSMPQAPHFSAGNA